MAQANRGVSTVKFVIAGALLAAFLIGGVFLVRQQTVQFVTETEAVAAEPDNSSQEKAAVQEEVTNYSATEKTAELPRTGSVGTLSAVVSLALLSFMAVSYVRSRCSGLLL